MFTVDPHPLLDPVVFTATIPSPLSTSPSPEWLVALLKPDAPAPPRADDAVPGLGRDLLRHGGYKQQTFTWYRELLEKPGAAVERQS